LLQILENTQISSISGESIEELKRRKLITENSIKYYRVMKGVNYSEKWIELTSELTADMLRDGTW
jgi:uncharacterized protein (UPF0248 family)